MDLKELNELDLNNIGEWPVLVKVLLVLVVCGAVVGAWYYWDTQKQFVELEKVERVEQDLRKEFAQKQAKAVNLEAYKQQLAEMQESFGAMLRQLPDKRAKPYTLHLTAHAYPTPVHQCTVHTMQGSKLRTMC